MRVCEIDLYPVDGFRLVLLLGLENKLLKDRIIPRYNTACPLLVYVVHMRHVKTLPDRQDFTATSIGFPTAPYTQPVAPVINGVCRIKGGLEYHTCLDFAGCYFVIALFLVVSERVVSCTGKTGSSCAGCGLELARTLPFRATGKPKH